MSNATPVTVQEAKAKLNRISSHIMGVDRLGMEDALNIIDAAYAMAAWRPRT